MILACRHVESVDALLAADADITKGGSTPLIEASKHGPLEIIKALLSAGADVQDATNDGKTALDMAIGYGDVGVIELLLAAGAAKRRK